MNWVILIVIIGCIGLLLGLLAIACVIAGARAEANFEQAREEMNRAYMEDR